MDLNRILIWIISLSCIAHIVQNRSLGKRIPRTTLVPAAVLMITGLTTLVRPDLGGAIGSVFWGLFLVMPTLTFNHVGNLVGQSHFQAAAEVAQGSQWLYQLYGLDEIPPLLQAVVAVMGGKDSVAQRCLDRYSQAQTPTGRMAIAEVYRLQGRWSKLLDWSEEALFKHKMYRDPMVILAYLRALGELGELNTLVLGFQKFLPALERTDSPQIYVAVAQLFVLAFCGRPDAVRQLLLGPLSYYATEVQLFWVATAELRAGRRDWAVSQMMDLRGRHGHAIERAVELRLSRAAIQPNQVLTETTQPLLDQIQIQTVPDPILLDTSSTQRSLQPIYATYAIVALNAAAFALEVYAGGSQNEDVLIQLGGMVPHLVFDFNQGWRLLTATLLHFGWLHLAMNMAGLLFIGSYVERVLGVPQYLLVYWTAGIGSMATSAYFWLWGLTEANLVIGASGSIMGMVGAAGVILFRIWQAQRSVLAMRQFRTILVIIGLQTVFDLTTPQVSFIGHTSGLVIGGVLTMLLLLFPFNSERVKGSPT